ncbi:MAG TPA: hypothetical protein PKK32_01970, partial [Candidatus Paceibacterota bacterium]|nr:hypothetical protein [Candidatus Paceibacterota bacterium]
MKKKEEDKIIIKGVKTNNLKNINVEMPRNKIIAITGVSGSGKSSLAFDTIFAEGQRRYVESLSSYARQFLNQMPKPDVEEITGLSPAISIDQKSRSNNPRSTVATITEIYDYLRVLYSRIGHPHCPVCGQEIKKLSTEEILNFIVEKIEDIEKNCNKKDVLGVKWSDEPIKILSPIVRGRKGEYYQLLYDLLNKGFTEVRIDGEIKKLRDRIEMTKNKKHDIEIIVDSFQVHEFKDNKEDSRMRLAESVERAILESEGLVLVVFGDDKKKKIKSKEKSLEEFLMSTKFACPFDGFSFPEIEPRLFSFNSPYGACPSCNGLGTKYFGGQEVCPDCGGKRLRPEALNVFLGNEKKDKKDKEDEHTPFLNIADLTKMTIEQTADFFVNLKLSPKEKEISKNVINEIESRLQFLLNVGLDYLSLDRRANTLSGGEAQRIRLASQLG